MTHFKRLGAEMRVTFFFFFYRIRTVRLRTRGPIFPKCESAFPTVLRGHGLQQQDSEDRQPGEHDCGGDTRYHHGTLRR